MALRLHPHASACGKVILLGEHSVVHGYPALAAGLSDGIALEANALPNATDTMTLAIPEWDLDLSLTADSEHPVARACHEVLTHCDGPVTGWSIRGRSRIPSRAGLGSSAALTVALARLALGEDAEHGEVVAASLAGERVFHGQPSGIDSHVAAAGGVLQFIRGRDPEPVPLREPLRLLVMPSGVPRSTADQVAKVSDRLKRLPALARPALELLGAAVREGRTALERADYSRLGEIMDISHETLSGLGVSSRVLDELCADARDGGALGAKLTGAGGGGCCIALPPEHTSIALDALLARGIEPFEVEVSP